MPRLQLFIALFFGTSPFMAMAEEPPTPLSYDVFESAIPHVDLENCPKALEGEDRFCRATLNQEELHIFVFSTDGESPMVGFASYEADRLSELLN